MILTTPESSEQEMSENDPSIDLFVAGGQEHFQKKQECTNKGYGKKQDNNISLCFVRNGKHMTNDRNENHGTPKNNRKKDDDDNHCNNKRRYCDAFVLKRAFADGVNVAEHTG